MPVLTLAWNAVGMAGWFLATPEAAPATAPSPATLLDSSGQSQGE